MINQISFIGGRPIAGREQFDLSGTLHRELGTINEHVQIRVLGVGRHDLTPEHARGSHQLTVHADGTARYEHVPQSGVPNIVELPDDRSAVMVAEANAAGALMLYHVVTHIPGPAGQETQRAF